MSVGSGTMGLVTLLMMNLLCVFFAPVLGVATLGDLVVFQLFDKDDFETGTVDEVNPSVDDEFSKELTASSVGGPFGGFLDGLKKVFSFLITILGLGFALFTTMTTLGAPFMLSAIIGLPVALVFYMLIVSAVRGFSI